MDDQERTNLVEKLQKEVQDYVSQLKPKKYEDGWPEDRWEEEIEKHPIFMTKPIEEGQELPPLVEALQNLKYDPDVNTVDELATSYKEDGNANFKNKKYRWAIDSYTQGLNWKCEDKELKAQLYLNRAAAHFHIGNFEKALKDAIEAKSLKLNYVKAIHRGALCCRKLKLFDDCISWCDEGLKIEEKNTLLIDLKNIALDDKKIAERDKRKSDMMKVKREKENKIIKNAIQVRGIHVAEGKNFDIEKLEPMHPSLAGFSVTLDTKGKLNWPVLLLYPEYGITEAIQQFHEDSCLQEHLNVMFDPEDLPAWDKEHLYLPLNLQVYFTIEKNSVVEIDKQLPLILILKDKRFLLHGGTPCFLITARNTSFDAAFRIKNKLC